MKDTVTIESMAYQGAGVGRTPEGKTIFVEGGIAGDVVLPLHVQELSSYDRCSEFELIVPSSSRIETRCSFAGQCDGCPWQNLRYEEQLFWKRRFVVDALERIGTQKKAEELVAPCVASPLQWHYRNKVELHAAVQNGKLSLGYTRKNSNEHVCLSECLLMPEALVTLPQKLEGALNYSLRESVTQLKRVAIRHSLVTGSTEISLYMLPSGVNRSFLAKTLSQNVELTSLVRVIVDGNMAARKVKKVEVLSGKGYWQERLVNNNYKISAPSFFQINSGIAEAMIRRLQSFLDELELDEKSPVADLYCGAGTFTLPLAKRFEQVSAIESYGSSIRDLRRNLDDAGLEAEVIGGDVARELVNLKPVALAVVDPPRSGLRPEAVKALLEHQTPCLVYVSCNPATMARDISLLSTEYELIHATPFDQFPQSYHVEIMALLKRR